MKKGNFISTALGVLGFFILAAIVLIVSSILEVGVFVSLLIVVVVGIIVILIISAISKKSDEHKEYKAKNNGTWVIPTDLLLKKCTVCGLVNVATEESFIKAHNIIKSILNEKQVPVQFHEQYLSHTSISGCFETMHKSPSWNESELIKKINAFYQDCLNNNITLPLSGSTIQKANLIAEKYFKDFDINMLIYAGKQLEEEKQAKIESEEKKALEIEERNLYKELTKYANIHGRDKYLKELDDYRIECEVKLNELKEKVNMSTKNADAFMQKERSWGLAGGIAEGIAGPVAGVMAASEVQRDNERIRQQNKDTASALGQLQFQLRLHYGPTMDKYENEIKKTINDFQNGRILLVEDSDIETSFSHLTISETNISVSKTGTATVTATITSEPFYILDGIPAVVDGTITVHIWEGNKEIGQTILVLPKAGTLHRKKLKCIALFACDPTKQYHVTFTPNDLWCLELPANADYFVKKLFKTKPKEEEKVEVTKSQEIKKSTSRKHPSRCIYRNEKSLLCGCDQSKKYNITCNSTSGCTCYREK